MRRRSIVLSGAVLAALAMPIPVLGHSERHTESPPRLGPVPDPSRQSAAVIDVCKTGDCPYEHIQDAVNAATVEGTLIRIWPGLYKEEPYADSPSFPPDMGGLFSYGFQVEHPNSENLIAILGEVPAADGSPSGVTNPGKKNLTLRGMGQSPRDVVIDAQFKKHVGIRGDNADGLIIENLSVWHAFDHGVYVLDTDGFLLDRVHSGYAREYPFLVFANDYGKMTHCEGFGGGDAGIYPGGSADTPGRHSMEVAHSKSYENVLGYSGSNGDHVWVHDSEFFGNSIGFVSDSLTDHPNYPQNNLVFERNLVYDNNLPVYEPNSNVKPTVFANSLLIPVGVGVFLATGDDNLVQNNHIWGNDRYGVWLASGEGLVIGPTSDPPALPIVSSGNRFIANAMFPPADAPAGASGRGNGVDFAWDGMGFDNCWEANTSSAGGAPASSDPPLLPPCHDPLLGRPMPATAFAPWVPNLVEQAMLIFVEDPLDGNQPKPLCAILGLEPCEWNPSHPEQACNTPAGLSRPECNPETPESCGPGPHQPCESACGPGHDHANDNGQGHGHGNSCS